MAKKNLIKKAFWNWIKKIGPDLKIFGVEVGPFQRLPKKGLRICFKDKYIGGKFMKILPFLFQY